MESTSRFAYPDIDSANHCTSCGRPRQIGDWPDCPHTRGGGGNRITAIHASERTVVYRNPRTGEVRYPPRNDQPIHPKYAAQGYERQELTSAQDVRQFEKETGRVHERTWFNPGSGGADRSLETGISDAPKITGLDRAYEDRELIGQLAIGVE